MNVVLETGGKVKKEILSMTLILAMGLILSACGGSGTESSKEASKTGETKVSTVTKEAVEPSNSVSGAAVTGSAVNGNGDVEFGCCGFVVRTGTKIRLGGLKGPTTMGLVKLLDNAKQDKTINDYEFTMATMADEIAPKLLKGELDIIAAPVNLGSVLYNKSKGKIKMLAVNTLGVLYIGEKGGEGVKSIGDLKGKTILATGKGTTPEYVLRKLLKSAGEDIYDEVKIEWKSEPAEVLSALKKSDSSIALLPQPFFTVAKEQIEGFRTAIDLNVEWEKLEGAGKLVTAGFFTTADFIEKNTVAVDAFMEEYNYSSDWVNKNLEEGSKLIENEGIVKSAIALKALPETNITYIKGAEMKEAVNGYLSVLNELNPKSIGGKLPEMDFYYEKAEK